MVRTGVSSCAGVANSVVVTGGNEFPCTGGQSGTGAPSASWYCLLWRGDADVPGTCAQAISVRSWIARRPNRCLSMIFEAVSFRCWLVCATEGYEEGGEGDGVELGSTTEIVLLLCGAVGVLVILDAPSADGQFFDKPQCGDSGLLISASTSLLRSSGGLQGRTVCPDALRFVTR